MSDTREIKVTSGISPFLLFLVFLVLKLTNHIDWSWWWVTVPLWGGLALLISLGVLFFLVIPGVYLLFSGILIAVVWVAEGAVNGWRRLTTRKPKKPNE